MSELNLTFGDGKTATIPSGLLIDNKFVPALDGKTLDVENPSTGKVIGKVACAGPKDVDAAIKAAKKAFETVYGYKMAGDERGRLLMKLADAIDAHQDEIAAIESLDNGKPFWMAKGIDVAKAAQVFRYYAGWADKDSGTVVETDNESTLIYTRNEPIGVVGQIIPWNFPLLMLSWKLGPALATGCTVVLKTAEQTPLSAIRVAMLIKDIFPPGVVNILTGLGNVAGAALASHPDIEKIAFTGSTLVGRTIMKAAASSNLKKVTLELGGKSANIIFNDADVEQAVRWAAFGFTFNAGQTCCAGSRVYVQSGIYDKVLAALTDHVKSIKVGDAFTADSFQGPQVSKVQFDRIMEHIESGKQTSTLHTGGNKHSSAGEGHFIEPTIFTNVPNDSRIAREEIFGPVLVLQKFTDTEDVIKIANDSVYGLAAAIFTRDISQAITTAHRLQAGTVWVNCVNTLYAGAPFGGFKQSGIGRELGQEALKNYRNVKTVQVNLNAPAP
ncbi:uncharacterized protein L969DRAFT_90152 [Mixia osmundae IAM 14324]|uniref:Aldehyde dehydrogenase domain-containing protein n=1 Tax=Mixia osmundae (strain CBS 9802 / IAM 14324 / JCM 22182 / KY 12970) TaxID=764103 RepID=G7DSX0_MIXOS|nr:uncharacterized protein L969DRAFT_90152 [Mixia osmundae IAM 14324]KEI37094.1 hypothetical protein L969DRAFT_90152 [Mixia osmundae IAM 14324]GAA93680.1 hypothetical protein E5Q_00325 [Mixia osmundae IAM 14324]